MKKKITVICFNTLSITLLFLLVGFNMGAQDENRRLPSKEEVDAKQAKLASINWETSLGKINPKTGVLVTGAEQNCDNAIQVCSQSYLQDDSYTGVGTVQELNSTCLLGGETNSVWYIFTAQSSGTFGFNLTTTKDYDFALYNITTIGCAGIPTATPVRCNFSGTLGNTGMSIGTTSTELPALSIPSTGIPTSNGISDMVAGQTYALIVDNWSADALGYNLTFTGTASITDVTPPTINPPNSVVNNCNGTFTLNLSEPCLISSIATNGSDFTLTGGGVVTSVSASGSTSGAALTSAVTINYTVPTSGSFTLGVQAGTDGNTILDKCGNAMSTSQTVTVNVLNSLTLTPSLSTVCTPGTAIVLTAAGAPNSTGTYTLNPGGLTAAANGSGQATFNVNPNVTTSYVLNMTYGGCTGSATTTVTIQNNVVVSISPINPVICSGSTPLTASTTINGVACPTCTFQWSGASTATTSTVTGTPGTYSVTTATSAGCTGNTATTTVSLASTGGGSTCNVYFVNSVSGAGDCLTKATPGGLTTALALANCNNAIIYMAKGIYTFTDAMNVNSFVTIEGGFNSTFTIKSSDLTGGANSTTIRRSNTADSDDAGACSAFKVSASASNFRFQDLRIEMPGNAAGTVTAHTAGTTRSNYGIKMGPSCTSYKVVRCYIDAGAGSAP